MEPLKTGGSNKSVKRVAAACEQTDDRQRSHISLLLKETLVISASEIWKTASSALHSLEPNRCISVSKLDTQLS